MTVLLPDTFRLPTSDTPAPRGILVLRTRRENRRRALILLVCAIVAACLIAASIAYLLAYRGSDPATAPRAVGRMTIPASVRDSAVIYDTAVMPLAPEQASAINANRPLDVTRVIAATPLRLSAQDAAGTGYGAALRCLTQAIYYEAASEPDAGLRAVAQVVLNRARHPAFPKTVCGVVYQGSERVTGCQFSFTCDGSLARVPSLGGWARAERVARDALSGRVAAEVGNATHYHADYVVPYWAPTLDKTATVGAHIFYIMRGFLGSPRAFSRRYDVTLEAPPAPAMATEILAGEQPDLLKSLAPADSVGPQFGAPVEDARAGNLVTESVERRLRSDEAAALRADEERSELKQAPSGKLKIDESSGEPGDEASPRGGN